MELVCCASLARHTKKMYSIGIHHNRFKSHSDGNNILFWKEKKVEIYWMHIKCQRWRQDAAAAVALPTQSVSFCKRDQKFTWRARALIISTAFWMVISISKPAHCLRIFLMILKKAIVTPSRAAEAETLESLMECSFEINLNLMESSKMPSKLKTFHNKRRSNHFFQLLVHSFLYNFHVQALAAWRWMGRSAGEKVIKMSLSLRDGCQINDFIIS